MSFLKSLNRYMERNRAASRALIEQFDKSTISDMDDFSEKLWVSIDSSSNKQYLLEIFNNEETPLEFIVKLFIKIGFSCVDSVRLMMKIQKNGSVVLARAEETILLSLQEYINTQAKAHGFCLASRIKKT
ncbi:MAG: ATP-dependent Clp protease adaptor ClpS [Pseudomonadales bacterium]|nr:ATP-dependent Clp protease adaptor ClpS [Pseudomonadales bacterium]